MTPTGERGETTWDVEALLATRCGRSTRRSGSRADRGHLHGAVGGGRDRALRLGRGATDSEMRALRDPRNWVRPVVAVGVGGVATGALVLFELRRRGKHEANGLKGLACRRPRPLLGARGVAGGGQQAEKAQGQVQRFVGAGRGEEAQDRGARVEGQAPDAEDGQQQPGTERVGAGEAAPR